mmetsp:Transcript_23730/g.34550  ORF Transcript_23730/g.34550 Transcript_23730/m.34550 type:complete len:300 (-) Transcript_23730:523-1422(-)
MYLEIDRTSQTIELLTTSTDAQRKLSRQKRIRIRQLKTCLKREDASSSSSDQNKRKSVHFALMDDVCNTTIPSISKKDRKTLWYTVSRASVYMYILSRHVTCLDILHDSILLSNQRFVRLTSIHSINKYVSSFLLNFESNQKNELTFFQHEKEVILTGKIKGCTLGFERSKYQAFVKNVISNVLAEQLRQRYEGIVDEEKLRHVSIQFSRFSEMVARKIASIVEYDDMFCPDDETRTTQNRKRRFSRSDKRRRSLVPKRRRSWSSCKSQKEEESNTEMDESKTSHSLNRFIKRLSFNKK